MLKVIAAARVGVGSRVIFMIREEEFPDPAI
jgi:hypothetical protein